jgi:hypothetical protein
MMIVVVLGQAPSRQRSIGLSVLAAIVVAAVLCIPLLSAIARLREWSGLIEYQRVPPTISEAFGAKWTLPALTAVFASLAWRRSRRRRATVDDGTLMDERSAIWWPVFLWLIPLAVVATMAISGNPMLSSPRYRVMVVCPSALAMGLALGRAFPPAVAVLMTAAVLAVSTFVHGMSPAVAGRLVNEIEEEWKRVALELRSEFDDPRVLVFTQTGLAEGILLPAMSRDERFRKYVACRLGGFYTGSDRAVPIPLLWDGVGRLRDDYRALLNASSVRRVWIVGANDTDLNAESLTVFAGFIESSGFRPEAQEVRPGISLLRFQRVVSENSEK